MSLRPFLTRRRLLTAGLGGVVAALGIGVWWWQRPPPLAPVLTLTDLDGQRLHIGGRQPHPQLVQFWATNCAPCLRELPGLIKFYRAQHARGLDLVAIAMPYDQPRRVAAFARQMPLPYPVVLDARGVATKAFGDVQFTPTTFLIAPNGRIVHQYLGRLDFSILRKTIQKLM